MQQPLVVEFTKMSGAGNDFIVLDNRFYHFSPAEFAAMAPRICARRHGVGADGILALAAPKAAGMHYRMLYFNADGSEGTMCGNGARCLARYAVAGGMPPGMLHFETSSGPCSAAVADDSRADVRLFAGPPEDWRMEQPLAGPVPAEIRSVHYIWTGTEHVVCFLQDVRNAPVSVWGAEIRHDQALQPGGANVNFVQVKRGVARLEVRTYEKGVEAETLACGTGAMAAALAARSLGYVSAGIVEVLMPGGLLRVGLEEGLFLEGPAEIVYRGSFEL